MKHIVIFGAGKSSTFLIEYLVRQLPFNDWRLTVLDADQELALARTAKAQNTRGLAIDVENEEDRKRWVASADIVISLLPPSLHYLIALACLEFNKNLLTASYIDDRIGSLSAEIKNRGLLFLCEMGLDPGIDHMSAMKLIEGLHEKGANIVSFKSHCGGLVAPENDDNPWHYKVSWNPRNVVLAGKAGAIFKENGREKIMKYEDLFNANRIVEIPAFGDLAWYPNRDSLNYMAQYKLDTVKTFIRTTLRYPEFCFGWKNLVQLKFTDENIQYDTDGMTLKEFFLQHLSRHGFSEWVEKQLTSRFTQTKLLLEKLQQLLAAEEQANARQANELRDFMMVDDNGNLMDVNLDEVKTKAAATVAGQMHEANLAMKQLFFLGMDDDITVIDKGKCSAADILQFALEQKLALREGDRDMIIMLHELEYEIDGCPHIVKSRLLVHGEDNIRTAMAKTVGLPLGIAAKLILQGKISTTGLHIPIIPDIYEPLLEELNELGISFLETTVSSFPPPLL